MGRWSRLNAEGPGDDRGGSRPVRNAKAVKSGTGAVVKSGTGAAVESRAPRNRQIGDVSPHILPLKNGGRVKAK